MDLLIASAVGFVIGGSLGALLMALVASGRRGEPGP